MNKNSITLYPSNWLYNASIIGLLLSKEIKYKDEAINDDDLICNENGTVTINRALFKKLNIKDRFLEGDQKISIYRKGKYRNYLTTDNEKKEFIEFVSELGSIEKKGVCGVCNYGYFLPESKRQKNFLIRNKEFNFAHNSHIGPSVNKFPNAFWNNSSGTSICDLCNFIILHHHIAITSLQLYEEIFINAPSFKVMYELNKLVRETFGSNNKFEARSKRDILATSLIEYTNKIQTSLGIWGGMNIEIITKKKDVIDFYSLPYNVIKIITDREIASVLSDLSEFGIYNAILSEKYGNLIEIAQKLLKLSVKESLSNNDLKLQNSLIHNWKNQNNLTSTANKILKLYSLIEDKIKRK